MLDAKTAREMTEFQKLYNIENKIKEAIESEHYHCEFRQDARYIIENHKMFEELGYILEYYGTRAVLSVNEHYITEKFKLDEKDKDKACRVVLNW